MKLTQQASWMLCFQGLETKFLRWNTEFSQLGFVDSNSVIVSFGSMVNGVGEVFDEGTFGFKGLFDLIV